MLKKMYEVRCGVVFVVFIVVLLVVFLVISIGVVFFFCFVKGNNWLSWFELLVGEVIEMVVIVEEVSEEVVVEECILMCEWVLVKVSVEVGEVRGCFGVMVRRRVGVDNCVYFVGGVEVEDLEVVLLIEEEV